MTIVTGAAEQAPPRGHLAPMALAALGVVYGDIGTSPLYTFKTAIAWAGGEATPAAALGMLSLIVWTLIITTSIKYVAIVMRADNDGEGGILTPPATASRARGTSWPHHWDWWKFRSAAAVAAWSCNHPHHDAMARGRPRRPIAGRGGARLWRSATTSSVSGPTSNLDHAKCLISLKATGEQILISSPVAAASMPSPSTGRRPARRVPTTRTEQKTKPKKLKWDPSLPLSPPCVAFLPTLWGQGVTRAQTSGGPRMSNRTEGVWQKCQRRIPPQSGYHLRGVRHGDGPVSPVRSEQGDGGDGSSVCSAGAAAGGEPAAGNETSGNERGGNETGYDGSLRPPSSSVSPSAAADHLMRRKGVAWG